METARETSIDATHLKDLMFKLDINKTGKIKHQEFFACLMNREEIVTARNMEELYNEIDVNGSKTLSLSELKKGLPMLAGQSDDTLLKLMKQYDLANGQIPKNDFIGSMNF